VDVLFSPSYTLPLGIRGKCVVTNLGPPENTPLSYQWFRAHAYEALYLASAHRADRVLACSHSVRQRLVDVYRVPADKISVTYLAASQLFRPIQDPSLRSEVRARYRIPDGPFILFVGKMARRHYIPNLIEAFARLKADPKQPYRLVLVGPDYLKLDIMGIARRFGVAAHVTHVPYATHSDLPAIYSAAEFFVFPASAAEGFGIPVVEAMACGTPVVTTALGSVREVATGAALTTSAPSSQELFEAMLKMASDPELRQKLVPLGIERARQFTWPITAKKTMDVLWKVAQG
jgi:glycosyltransferase involved in cell wall biosynthesis